MHVAAALFVAFVFLAGLILLGLTAFIAVPVAAIVFSILFLVAPIFGVRLESLRRRPNPAGGIAVPSTREATFSPRGSESPSTAPPVTSGPSLIGSTCTG